MNRDIEIAINIGNLTLAELVEDPLVDLMMKSDGIDRDSIEALFQRLAQLRRREDSTASSWPFPSSLG